MVENSFEGRDQDGIEDVRRRVDAMNQIIEFAREVPKGVLSQKHWLLVRKICQKASLAELDDFIEWLKMMRRTPAIVERINRVLELPVDEDETENNEVPEMRLIPLAFVAIAADSEEEEGEAAKKDSKTVGRRSDTPGSISLTVAAFVLAVVTVKATCNGNSAAVENKGAGAESSASASSAP